MQRVSVFRHCVGRAGVVSVRGDPAFTCRKHRRSDKESEIMASKEDVRARAPRGTKTLTQAFFAALDGIPGAQQKAVATAALAAIRDELKAQRLKAKDVAS